MYWRHRQVVRLRCRAPRRLHLTPPVIHVDGGSSHLPPSGRGHRSVSSRGIRINVPAALELAKSPWTVTESTSKGATWIQTARSREDRPETSGPSHKDPAHPLMSPGPAFP